MSKTNAIRLLEAQGVGYEPVEYTYDVEDLKIAADLGLPVAQVFKTLVARGDKTSVLVAVIPGDTELDYKLIAKASGNKKVALVHMKELLGLTGYIRGGCSPLGMKKHYPVYIHTSAQNWDKIFINAGKRGLLIGVKPEELREVTGGEWM
jgi:Cys-tRNA(Pro)/Cys-tRNA(Cys) deacylase